MKASVHVWLHHLKFFSFSGNIIHPLEPEKHIADGAICVAG